MLLRPRSPSPRRARLRAVRQAAGPARPAPAPRRLGRDERRRRGSAPRTRRGRHASGRSRSASARRRSSSASPSGRARPVLERHQRPRRREHGRRGRARRHRAARRAARRAAPRRAPATWRSALEGEAFTVDPNRIFTPPAGRGRSPRLSRDTPAARAAVAAFADTLLAVYGTPDVVVALHNNTEANYSAASYQPGGSEANEAADVHLLPGCRPRRLRRSSPRAPLFDAVVAWDFNAILQNNATPTDDGSLSVWAAQSGRPYLNVEAQHGHRAENARMIEAIPSWTAP